MQIFVGSQWSSGRTGVMWLMDGDLLMMRAAAFWTSWCLWMNLWGRPKSPLRVNWFICSSVWMWSKEDLSTKSKIVSKTHRYSSLSNKDWSIFLLTFSGICAPRRHGGAVYAPQCTSDTHSPAWINKSAGGRTNVCHLNGNTSAAEPLRVNWVEKKKAINNKCLISD